MGIVKRQGVKFSIISYIALFLGTINVLFIYPYALEPDELGLVRFVMEAAMMAVPFISLGFGNVAIKYFPDFRNSHNKHNGFLFLIYFIPLISFLIFCVVVMLFKTDINEFYTNRNSLFSKNILFIIPLTLFILLANLTQSYCYNFQRIVVPNILNNLLIKITLPILALTYFFGYISLSEVVLGIVLTFFLVLVGFLIYINLLGQFSLKPNFSFLDKVKIKEIGTYSFYGILTGAGSILALRIDTFMIASMVDLTSTGIYTIAVFISGVIAVPFKGLANIGSSIISKAWAENDLKAIKDIYKKSSIILLITGGFLFLIIWASIDDFFAIMPNGEKYLSGKNVVLILGIAKLIDIACSLNDRIINYSKFFRFNFYAILILAALNLTNNFILIPKYQMIGAALATLISITVFNLIKLIYIKMKVNIQPFSINTVYVVALGILCLLVNTLIPDFSSSVLNIVINVITVSLIFAAPIIYFKISEDFNDVVFKILNRIKSVF